MGTQSTSSSEHLTLHQPRGICIQKQLHACCLPPWFGEILHVHAVLIAAPLLTYFTEQVALAQLSSLSHAVDAHNVPTPTCTMVPVGGVTVPSELRYCT